jgi:hypothetical protein
MERGDALDVVNALNKYLPTEDNTPITPFSPYFRSTLWSDVMNHNQTQADIVVQAFIGRMLMNSGERLVASLAHGRLRRRELVPHVRHTLLEMMLVVAMATLAYVLLKK